MFRNKGLEFPRERKLSQGRGGKQIALRTREKDGRKPGTNGRTVTSWVNAAWRKVTGFIKPSGGRKNEKELAVKFEAVCRINISSMKEGGGGGEGQEKAAFPI